MADLQMYSEEWYALKRREVQLEASPYWRKGPTRPMSPDREERRSAPLSSPRHPAERPPSPERAAFSARPMPPHPEGASRGAHTRTR
jgi:hypothetical protein